MAEITFDCDRCGTTITGHEYEHFTAGYYEVGLGAAWHDFAQDGEKRICDQCMWANAEYREIYGVHR